MRVALLISIPAPYRIPVYRDLAETPGWTLRIFASAESEFDRSWQVDAKDLDIVTPRSVAIRQRVSDRGIGVRRVVTRHLPIGLFSALCHFRPDVVIGGELGLRSLVALAYALITFIGVIAVTKYVTLTPGMRPDRRDDEGDL